jgi:hypothetical protein
VILPTLMLLLLLLHLRMPYSVVEYIDLHIILEINLISLLRCI